MKISNSDEQRNRPGDRLASHRARRLTHARRSSKCFGGRVPRAQPWGESWTCGAGTSSVRFMVVAHFDRQDIGVHDTDTRCGPLPDNAEHFLGIRGPAQETLQEGGVFVVSHVKDFKPAQDGPPRGLWFGPGRFSDEALYFAGLPPAEYNRSWLRFCQPYFVVWSPCQPFPPFTSRTGPKRRLAPRGIPRSPDCQRIVPFRRQR